jgi:hypothetical protein
VDLFRLILWDYLFLFGKIDTTKRCIQSALNLLLSTIQAQSIGAIEQLISSDFGGYVWTGFF